MASYLRENLSFDNARVEILNEDDGKGGKSLKMKGAFLYKWTELTTNMWYIGSRTAQGCGPSDGYICSSKSVKPKINGHANNWKREILVIGESTYIRELEAKYLTLLDAKHDPMSYNMHNGDGKFTTAGKKMPRSKESIEKQRKTSTGMKKPAGFGEMISKRNSDPSLATRKKMSAASTGRVQSETARAKNRVANSGTKNQFYGKHHSADTLAIMAEKRKLAVGERSALWSGFWVSPIGEKFTLLKDAAAKYSNISSNTIRVWSKANKNGWSFAQVKEKV